MNDTQHWHVGANMPGYMPEGDIECYPSATDALTGLVALIEREWDSAAMADDEADARFLEVHTQLHSTLPADLQESGAVTVHAGYVAYWAVRWDDRGGQLPCEVCACERCGGQREAEDYSELCERCSAYNESRVTL